jgi:hypothetical protein
MGIMHLRILSPNLSATSKNTIFDGRSFVNHSLVLMIVITSFSPCIYKTLGAPKKGPEDRHAFVSIFQIKIFPLISFGPLSIVF